MGFPASPGDFVGKCVRHGGCGGCGGSGGALWCSPGDTQLSTNPFVFVGGRTDVWPTRWLALPGAARPWSRIAVDNLLAESFVGIALDDLTLESHCGRTKVWPTRWLALPRTVRPWSRIAVGKGLAGSILGTSQDHLTLESHCGRTKVWPIRFF